VLDGSHPCALRTAPRQWNEADAREGGGAGWGGGVPVCPLNAAYCPNRERGFLALRAKRSCELREARQPAAVSADKRGPRALTRPDPESAAPATCAAPDAERELQGMAPHACQRGIASHACQRGGASHACRAGEHVFTRRPNRRIGSGGVAGRNGVGGPPGRGGRHEGLPEPQRALPHRPPRPR